ncbi:MAG: hypothetical protein IK099_01295, partial [Clostridia bacterium]|nr:hypothetical protein [Clostridia bacterium]
FSYFIKEELEESIEEIFKAVLAYIVEKDHVDMQHVYIDGSKFEANANKYTWVWEKHCMAGTWHGAFVRDRCGPFQRDRGLSLKPCRSRICPAGGKLK